MHLIFCARCVVVAILLFGTQSPEVLAIIEGVFVEDPVMLIFIKIANNMKGWFESE
ncbi:hypothetical protein [Garciella nitratireducens]|uniref:Arsenite transporter, ACR3 family n=1 Tax=Garciella nitratireducens DSM 15102 TaxID=1121911 RepID=A0A1T4N4E8_9FIRM|nr:hypothetical protein [Garciella nitratireducens]RBP38207.1 hypothetical protein DFR81_1202 [Garciella nitratireducens]SJZ73996.1 arsenite transporter, ACR3 family [Garciella nitratireducens DSM 15102]